MASRFFALKSSQRPTDGYLAGRRPCWNKAAPPHGQQRNISKKAELCFGLLQVAESLEETEFVHTGFLCGTHMWGNRIYIPSLVLLLSQPCFKVYVGLGVHCPLVVSTEGSSGGSVPQQAKLLVCRISTARGVVLKAEPKKFASIYDCVL